MIFAVENWKDCAHEMRPLWKLHWEEVGDYAHKIPVDLAEDNYLNLAEQGLLHLVTARDKAKKLWGYVWHVRMFHPHHRSLAIALLDLWYMHPDKRFGGAGVKLFLFAERKLKELGVKKFQGGHTLNKALENVFERLGYTPTELHYVKMVA